VVIPLSKYLRGGALDRMRGARMLACVLACVLAPVLACAPGITVVGGTVSGPSPRADTTPVVISTPQSRITWPVRVREHVDLWLHGFALLQADSTLIPYYRRDYRSRLMTARSAAGLTTQLDINADRLRARLLANPGLVSAQFLPLYFASWEELRQAADLFLRLEGNARAARDQPSADAVATFGAYFATAADRDWLRLFLQSLDDERAKFYSRYWREEQRNLAPVFNRVDGAWRSTYGPRFERFLRNSQQRDGEILLALPLAGEGRTLTIPRTQSTTVAVGFPSDTAASLEALYAFAHEIVGRVANDVVTDNTSPADRRNGVSDRYASLAAVRGGAMLLKRVAPELETPYMTYYLTLARRPPTAGDVERAFATIFPLPDGLRDALARQIDIILGGI
jgi:hypothetical protein